jgi:hypothetical protein
MSNLGRINDLEEQFFFKENQRLAEKYRAMRQLKETKEALTQVSGIEDEMILDKLIELNIRPETLASISLVPLVEVAWADGVVDPKEKEAILRSVSKFGWNEESLDYAILDEWLSRKPSASLLEAWKHYIQAICGKMSDEEIKHFKNEIISHALSVAQAEGGFMGIGSVSKEEKAMLENLENSFCR